MFQDSRRLLKTQKRMKHASWVNNLFFAEIPMYLWNIKNFNQKQAAAAAAYAYAYAYAHAHAHAHTVDVRYFELARDQKFCSN